MHQSSALGSVLNLFREGANVLFTTLQQSELYLSVYSTLACMILAWADQSWNARSKYRRHARMSSYGLWQIEHGR